MITLLMVPEVFTTHFVLNFSQPV